MKRPAAKVRKKAKKRPKKKRARVTNQRCGRIKTMPFEEVVLRLLETPPARAVKKASLPGTLIDVGK